MSKKADREPEQEVPVLTEVVAGDDALPVLTDAVADTASASPDRAEAVAALREALQEMSVDLAQACVDEILEQLGGELEQRLSNRLQAQLGDSIERILSRRRDETD